MIAILNETERAALRAAGRVARATLDRVRAELPRLRTTADIAELVARDTRERGGKPSQLGYQGFPSVVCTSKNQVVCHGIPSEKELLEPGDIVNVDVTTEFGGFHGDTSATLFIGTPSPEARHVVRVAEQARDVGIAALRVGGRLGEVGAAIQDFVEREGCSVVRDLGGHGIGRRMHMPPHVAHHREHREPRGVRLKEGMALTVEPMVNWGRPEVVFLDDGWTVVTADGALSAQFEHTVLLGANGPEIMT
ncbi:MAG TPA: type I methionyl aminopeptidase [Polyangiaceae bacterium]|nr:type I methionyl aminopeptidase [Polyangiaceae bacterium]